MITKIGAYKTSDNQTHASIEAAQEHELKLLLGRMAIMSGEPLDVQVKHVAAELLKNKEQVLTTTNSSKPRARKVNGGTKKRTPAADNAAINRALQDGKQ